MLTTFEHLVTHDLLYAGDCKLLGITGDGSIYAEELYGDDDWLAQHRIDIEGGIIETVDETGGDNPDIVPFVLPADAIKPTNQSCCESLHFSGARLRGIAVDERIEEVVHPLTVTEKMALVDFMEWEIDPMQVIGIAKSVVLSHTCVSDEKRIVCRRLRVAYKLRQPTPDYDYESLDVHIIHEYMPEQVPLPELVDCLNDIDDVVLLRPMDCLYHNGCLYVADGGEDDDVSAIHIFEISTLSDRS